MNINKMLPNIKENIIKVFSNKKVIIENYHFLDTLSKEKIRLKQYEIFGENLYIKRMDGYIIEIEGTIERITFM